MIFTKIIFPASFVSLDPITPFINDVEIEAECSPRLGFLAGFLSPNPCLACYLPGHRLLSTVPTAHPYVFRPVENGSKKWCPIKVLVCGNILQHLEHSPEMTPHYRKAEDSTGRGALLQNPLDIGDARWSAPAFFPGLTPREGDGPEKNRITGSGRSRPLRRSGRGCRVRRASACR